MADEECPHGLDPAWCSLCKDRSAAVLPSGVKRITPKPAPRVRSSQAGPIRRAGPPRAPLTPRGGADGLAATRKVLFHATAYGAWASIEAHGLRTAAELAAADPAVASLGRLREHPVEVHADGYDAVVRDQRPIARCNPEQHLDGVALGDWLTYLNDRVWFYAQQKDLTTLLSRYVPAGGQDVITFHTGRLLSAARGRVEVSTFDLTTPKPWDHCPCLGPGSLESLDRFHGPAADVAEVAVVGGLDSVEGLVARVVRHHPDHTIDVLVP